MPKFRTGRYRHFKGHEYEVLGMAKYSETLEDMIIYRASYGRKQTWVRPLTMFRGKAEKDGKSVPRFKYLGEK